MIDCRDVSVTFESPRGTVRAVDRLTMTVSEGGRASLLGESGCGKSVLALALLNLLPKNARVTGIISVDGFDMTNPETARQLRGGTIALCWSKAKRFFNPVLTIGDQIVEAYPTHHPGKGREGKEKGLALLARLGFGDPKAVFDSYPFQLSGGMNQRAMIAMSMINDPTALIADEPTRGLDDENRDKVVAALAALSGITLLLITHDIDCAIALSTDTYIMKAGVIVDRGPSGLVLSAPEHPYTRQLVGSCPHFWNYGIAPGHGGSARHD